MHDLDKDGVVGVILRLDRLCLSRNHVTLQTSAFNDANLFKGGDEAC